MKKIFLSIFVGIFSLVSFSFVSASEVLTCPPGQEVKNVIITPEVIGTPAVTHTVHHDAITHVATTTVTDIPAIPASTSYVYRGHNHGDYDKFGHSYFYVGHNNGDYDKVVTPAVPAVTHEEYPVVVDTPAWDEVVIDEEAIISSPAIYGDICVDIPPAPTPTVTSKVSQPRPSGGARHSCGYFGTCFEKQNPRFNAWFAINRKIALDNLDLLKKLVSLGVFN